MDYERLRGFATRFLEVAEQCRAVPTPPDRPDVGRSSGETELALARVEGALPRIADGLEALARAVLDSVDSYKVQDAEAAARVRRILLGGGS